MLDNLLNTYRAEVIIAAVGQVLFVVMWACLPFWKSWVGRALMVLSVGLGLILCVQSYLLFHPLLEPKTAYAITIALFAFLILGIYSQVIAIAREIWIGLKASKECRIKRVEDADTSLK